MKLAEVSIRRPTLTVMVMLAIVVAGAFSYAALPLDLFPDVDYPAVTVAVVYPGADPATVEENVVRPIEDAVNRVGGVRKISSRAAESIAFVIVELDLGVDFGQATEDVRDRVASVTLPRECDPPRIEKYALTEAPVLDVVVTGGADTRELGRIARETIGPELERLRGVVDVDIRGAEEREVHAWVDPERLASRGLTVTDVIASLRAQSVDVPGGSATSGSEEVVVRSRGRPRAIEDLAGLALATVAGHVVRLGDVAEIVDGAEQTRTLERIDGRPAVVLSVSKHADANAVRVADSVRDALGAIRSRMPRGVAVEVLRDRTGSIRESVQGVQQDLLLGALLIVLTNFLFLRNRRMTVVSALCLPICVLGTFTFVSAMGFTLNLLTTLALSFAIGIVIDDSVVVIENIQRRQVELGESPRVAALRGTAEVGPAVFASSLALVAVSIPVAFLGGIVGRFFYEFGLTIAFSIVVSLLVSLTLIPMLVTHAPGQASAAPSFGWVEALETRYRRVVRWALGHRGATMGLAAAALALAVAAIPLIGLEFIPAEDQGQFEVGVVLPTSTSMQESDRVMREMAAQIKQTPGVRSVYYIVGDELGRAYYAKMLVSLVDKGSRSYDQLEAMAHVRRLMARYPGVVSSVQMLPLISSEASQRLSYDVRGADLDEVVRGADRIAARLRRIPGFVDVMTTAGAGRSEVHVAIDPARTAQAGTSSLDVGMTVRALVTGEIATYLEHEGERYPVRVQLEPERRASADAIAAALVRTRSGGLVEVGSVAEVNHATGPAMIGRVDRERVVTIFANLEHRPLGDAMDDVERVASATLSHGVHGRVAGYGEAFGESLRSMLIAVALAILFTYIVLASQFESLVHPITVMISVPLAVVGALGALLIVRMPLSLFAFIGMFALVGVVAQNAILFVEFALQRLAAGQPIELALEEAGGLRLRAILMTALNSIAGALPLAIPHGPGGTIRAPLGVVVIGGLSASTVLTLVVVPVVFLFMEGFARRMRRMVGAPALRGAAAETETAAAAAEPPPERSAGE